MKSLLDTVANNNTEQYPSAGKTVRIDSGKHIGKTGIVSIHMRDKYACTRYSTDARLMLQDCVGRTGFVVKVDIGSESVWVKADLVTVISQPSTVVTVERDPFKLWLKGNGYDFNTLFADNMDKLMLLVKEFGSINK